MTPRDDLLDRAMQHVAVNGLSDSSLRELATGSGTSHRMLIYHFGSRDGLVAGIVERMEANQRASLLALAERAASPADVIRAQWTQLAADSVRPFVALFFEVTALAIRERPGTERFLERLTEPWISVASEAARRMKTPMNTAELRLGIAVVRGLLLELLISGDLDEVTESLERFLAMWG